LHRKFANPARAIALAVVSLIAFAHTVRAQAPDQSADVSATIDRGNALIDSQKFQQALDLFRQADAASNHTCADCDLGMVKADCELGDFQGALADAQRAITAAGDDRIVGAQALIARAGILVATSSGPADPALKEAEAEYRRALALDPKKSIARFSLGMLLLEEGRDAEGVAEMKAYVAGPFAVPRYVDRANRLIADPSRARALPSEDFSINTTDGRTISKTSLRGKVVLLDFWGSWCEPCRESIPIIADLHHKFSGAQFELVGINSDTDEGTLKSFAADHQMTWPEFQDLDGQISQLFEIQGFPTYVILGRDGTIAFQQTGLGSDTEEQLNKVITRELAKTYVASAAPSAPPVLAPSPFPPPVSAPASASRAPAAAPSARRVPVELIRPPDDIGDDDITGNLYRNAFLGFSYKFPADWTAASADALDQINHSRSQDLQANGVIDTGDAPGPDGKIRFAFPQVILEASPDQRHLMPAASISVAQTSASPLEEAQKEADRLKLQGAAIVAAPAAITIGRRQVIRFDFQSEQDGALAFAARFETTSKPGYIVILEISARSKQEFDELVATAQSLTFTGR
jgi:thiol-disulfide isomerase/thioredoxin